MTLTRHKVNLQYISGDSPHITSRFCKNELGLEVCRKSHVDQRYGQIIAYK